jgi:hypothetical protein
MSGAPTFIQVTAVVGGAVNFIRSESVESIVASGSGSIIVNRGKGALQVTQSPTEILELMNPAPEPAPSTTPVAAPAK